MARMLVTLFCGRRSLAHPRTSLAREIWRAMHRSFPNSVPDDYEIFCQYLNEVSGKLPRYIASQEYWQGVMAGLINELGIDDRSTGPLFREIVGYTQRGSPDLDLIPGTQEFLAWIQKIKSQDPYTVAETSWQAAITGYQLRRSQRITDTGLLRGASLGIAQPPRVATQSVYHDIDFLSYTGTEESLTPKESARFFHKTYLSLAALRDKILSGQGSLSAIIDLLFISRDPRINLMARSAGWSTLLLLGQEFQRTGENESMRGKITHMNASSFYTYLRDGGFRGHRSGPEDIVYDLRDGHLWRPPDLR